MELLTDLHLELDMSFVLWCQGEDPSGRLSPETQIELNQELIAESRDLLQPSVLYDFFVLQQIEDKKVLIDDGAIFHGRLLADRFGLARHPGAVWRARPG